MLVSFSVSNFKSILDTVELNMVAADEVDQSFPSTLIKGEGFSLNSLSVIYGPNGSGKSSILEAFRYFESIFNSFDQLKRPPKNKLALDDPTRMGVKFIENGNYDVSLTIFDDEAECIISKYINSRWEMVKIISRRSLSLFHSTLEEARGTEEIRDLSSFLRKTIFFDSIDDSMVNTDINGELKNVIGEELMKEISSSDNPARNIFFFDNSNVQSKRTMFQEILTHLGIEVEGVEYKTLENEREIDGEKCQVKILVPDKLIYKDYEVSLKDESSGTKRLVKLAHSLSLGLLMKRCLFVIDELDAGLHDVLASEIINLISDRNGNNPTLSGERPVFQLIFTTHNTVLLKEEVLRRDQIWFTEMKENRTTDLFSLSDLNGPALENYEEHYLKGDYGALPHIKRWEIKE